MNIKGLIAIILMFFFAMSCKQNEDKGQLPTTGKTKEMSLSKMQKNNGELIAQVERTLRTQVLKGEIDDIYLNADTSLKNEIDKEDLNRYFGLINDCYGKITQIKDYGTIMTAHYMTYDLNTKFSSGDSLELQLILSLYPDTAKLSYIGFNTFSQSKVSQTCFTFFNSIIALLLERNTKPLYSIATEQFKHKVTENAFEQFIKRKIPLGRRAEIIETKPLLFEKGNVGYLAKVNLFKDQILKEELVLAIYLIDNEKYIQDIQIKSLTQK